MGEYSELLKTKFCRYCGFKVEREKNICPKCGKIIITPVENLEEIIFKEAKNQAHRLDVYLCLLICVFLPILLFTIMFNLNITQNISYPESPDVYLILVIIITIIFSLPLIWIKHSKKKSKRFANLYPELKEDVKKIRNRIFAAETPIV